MKYLFITLKIQCGEYEFYSRAVHEVSLRANNEKYAENQAKTFYDDDDTEKIDDAFYFHAGSVAVRVESVKEISKTDAKVLKKHL